MSNAFFNSGLILGVIEEIEISKIKQVKNDLRFHLKDGYSEDLANSIKQNGLLQPIIIRSIEDGNFKIVAGNRRYCACKSLGYRKIACHIVELDDKAAFEVSLIENLQRKTLSPLEEAHAFRSYVSEYGYGGMTELACRLCKSASYITKRIKLLDLPADVLNSLGSQIDTSTAEELFALSNKSKQSELALLIRNRHLSLKKVRELVKIDNEYDRSFDPNHLGQRGTKHYDRIQKAEKSFNKTIIALRVAMSKIGTVLEGVDDDWMLYEVLMQHKNMLHSQIDVLIRQKKRNIVQDIKI